MYNISGKEKSNIHDEKRKDCIKIYTDVKNILSHAQSIVWSIEEAVVDASDVINTYYYKNNIIIESLKKNEIIYNYIERLILLRNEVSTVYKLVNGLDVFYHDVDNEVSYGEAKYKLISNNKIDMDKKIVEDAKMVLKNIYDRLSSLLDIY